MADLSVSADRSVCSGREWTYSLCHPHSRSTRSLSCGDFIREGNIHIRPNCCFSFPAGLYSTSLGPRDTAVSIHSRAECRHDPSGLLSANPANERTASEPPGECLWFHVIFSNQTSVRNASFLLSAILLFMVWFVLISWCCVYDTYNIPCIITSSREVRCICHAQLVVNVFVSDHSYLSLVSFSLILPLCHAALCLQSVWPWASSYTSPGNVRNAWPPFSHLISFPD